LCSAEPDNPKFVFDLARTQANLAVLKAQNSLFADAAAQCGAAVDRLDQLANSHPCVPGYRYGLVSALNSLGSIYKDDGDALRAKKVYQRAQLLLKELLDSQPDIVELWELQAQILWNESRLDGSPESIADEIRVSLEKYLDLVKKEARLLRQEPVLQLDAARVCQRIATFFIETDHPEIAVAKLEEAARIYRDVDAKFALDKECREGMRLLSQQLRNLGASEQAEAISLELETDSDKQ
jgi:tetratricopeptide (TPR) repeat protein